MSNSILEFLNAYAVFLVEASVQLCIIEANLIHGYSHFEIIVGLELVCVISWQRLTIKNINFFIHTQEESKSLVKEWSNNFRDYDTLDKAVICKIDRGITSASWSLLSKYKWTSHYQQQ